VVPPFCEANCHAPLRTATFAIIKLYVTNFMADFLAGNVSSGVTSCPTYKDSSQIPQ
jgi:hypothetical protein